jgi:L-ribulose-5-phosphate 3-epimerase
METNASPNDPSRRDLLKLSTAAAVAATTLGGLAVTAQENPAAKTKRPLKKAYFGLPKANSLLEQCKILKEAGFDGLQLNTPGPDIQAVKSAMQETGLRFEGSCCAAHWRLTLSDPDPSIRAKGLESLLQSIRDAKDLGGTSVLLVPGVVNEKVSYDDCYKRSQEQIKKAIPLATELGIKIAVENVWNAFHLSPLEAARYVDEFESPAVGWYFDIGNVINFGWPEQWIHILGKRIVKIHVKEFDKQKAEKQGRGAGFQTQLLEGSNNWPAIMKALDDVGYTNQNNWATIEMGGGDAQRMQTLSRQLDRILEA